MGSRISAEPTPEMSLHFDGKVNPLDAEAINAAVVQLAELASRMVSVAEKIVANREELERVGR